MNKQQFKKLAHLKPKDIKYGIYKGGVELFVDFITDKDVLDKCVILEDILFGQYHLDAQVSDDFSYLAVSINEIYKTSDELIEILISACKKLVNGDY